MRFAESVDADAVADLVDCVLLRSCLRSTSCSRLEGALEDGLLDALSVGFHYLSDAS